MTLFRTAPFTVDAMTLICLFTFFVVLYEIHFTLPFFWAAWRAYDDRG